MICIILPFFQLLTIFFIIHAMKLSHFLNLVKIHNKAFLVCMVLFNALSTEYCEMIRAVEMLYPLIVLVAKEALDAVFIFKIQISKDAVPLNDLVQNIEVQR